MTTGGDQEVNPLPAHPLAPVRVIGIEIGDVREMRSATPFIRIPVGIAAAAWKLRILAALPLHIGPMSDGLWPEPTPVLYFTATLPTTYTADPASALLWFENQPTEGDLQAIADHNENFFVLISRPDTEWPDAITRAAHIEVVSVPQDDTAVASLPNTIWEALVVARTGAMDERERASRIHLAPFINTHKPDDYSFSVDEFVAAANGGLVAPPYMGVPPGSFSSDLYASPNETISSLERGAVPTYIAGNPDDVHEYVAQLAKEILSARALRALLYTIVEQLIAGEQHNRALEFISSQDPGLAQSLAQIVGTSNVKVGVDAEASSVSFDDRLANLYSDLPDSLFQIAVHMVIICCTTTLTRPLSSLQVRGIDLQDPYTRQVIDAASGQRGRHLGVPYPTTSAQWEIVNYVKDTLLAESHWLTAMATLWGARFSTPVLKLPRIPEVMLQQLRQPTTVAGESELLTSLRTASQELTSYFPEPYLRFLGDLRGGFVHCLSDLPLEMAVIEDDFLAYRVALSRTPITPASTLTSNYLASAREQPLPRPGEGFVMATSLPEDHAAVGVLIEEIGRHWPNVRLTTVGTKTALRRELESQDCAAFMYFGHAYNDEETDNTSLEVGQSVFDISDVQRLSHVPRLVFLIGCTTQSAGSVMGAMGSHFLAQGATSVIGTTHPVPIATAAPFLLSLLGIISGTNAGPGSDLASCVVRARWHTRFAFAAHSLRASGRISEDLMSSMHTIYQNNVEDTGDVRAAIAQALCESGVLDDVDTPPVEWPVVPYGAFYSVIGFPWTSSVA